jgi:hypothetical protein
VKSYLPNQPLKRKRETENREEDGSKMEDERTGLLSGKRVGQREKGHLDHSGPNWPRQEDGPEGSPEERQGKKNRERRRKARNLKKFSKYSIYTVAGDSMRSVLCHAAFSRGLNTRTDATFGMTRHVSELLLGSKIQPVRSKIRGPRVSLPFDCRNKKLPCRTVIIAPFRNSKWRI